MLAEALLSPSASNPSSPKVRSFDGPGPSLGVTGTPRLLDTELLLFSTEVGGAAERRLTSHFLFVVSRRVVGVPSLSVPPWRPDLV